MKYPFFVYFSAFAGLADQRLFIYGILCFLGLFPVSVDAQSAKVEPVVQFGHLGSEITELVISSDGSLMATTDGIIVKLWDMKTGLEIRSLAEENRPGARIANISLSADASMIAYTFQGYAMVRSTENGSFIKQYPEPLEEEEDKRTNEEEDKKIAPPANFKPCHGVAFHPVETQIALMFDSNIEIRDLASYALVFSTPRPKVSTLSPLIRHAFRFSPDGMLLLADGAWVSSVSNRSFKYQLPKVKMDSAKYDYFVQDPLITGDRKHLIYFYNFSEKFDSIYSKKLRELEQRIKKDSTILDEEEGLVTQDSGAASLGLYVWKQAFSTYLDGFMKNGSFVVCEVSTGRILYQKEKAGARSIALSPDHLKMAIAYADQWVRFSEIVSDKELGKIKIEQSAQRFFNLNIPNAPPKITFTPDSKNAVIVAKFQDEENLGLWDITTGQKIRTLGADIPLINIDVTKVLNREVDMREFIEINNSSFLFPIKYEIERGYRMFDLAKGKVPAAFPKYDSIFYSPRRDYYLYQQRGNLAEIHGTDINERICYLENSTQKLRNVCFSYDGKYVAGSHKNVFTVWDAKNGKQILYNARHELLIIHLSFDPEGRYLVSMGEDDRVGFWDINLPNELEPVYGFGPSFNENFLEKTWRNRKSTLEKASSLVGQAKEALDKFKIPRLPAKTKAKPTAISAADNKLGTAQGLISTAQRLDRKTYFIENLAKYKGGYDVSYSEDGRYASIWINNYASVHVVDLEGNGGKPKKIGDVKDGQLMAMQTFVFGGRKNDKSVSPGDSAYWSYMLVNNFKKQFNLRNLAAFSPDFKYLANYQTTYSLKGEGRGLKKLKSQKIQTQRGIRVRCVESKNCKDFWLPESDGYSEGLTFGSGYIAASNRSTNTIRIWNAGTGDTVKSIKGHSGKLRFSPNGKVLFSSGWDRQVKAFDFESSKLLYSFIGIKGSNDYIIMLPNGYYTASRRNSRAVAFSKGRNAYPFEQFDLLFNQPDTLLEIFGEAYGLPGMPNPNAALAKAYQEARKKRLENLGYNPQDLTADIQVPEVILSKVPASSVASKIDINVKATDFNYNLDRLQIYINDVPIFGTRGYDLKKANKKIYQGTHRIELSNGSNKIQVSVFNTKGVESLRETARVECTAPAVKPTLYLILMGSGSFQDTSMNLDSPVRDLKSVETLFKTQSANYANIVPISLYDRDFTREKFTQIKSKLQNAGVNDRIIMMVSTHGLLDAKYNYYLATYDTDFKDPASKSLPYREIESLFEGTRARQRLVFIDACHAGELDTATLQNFQKVVKNTAGLKFRKGFRASAWNEVGYQESFDLMKDLFIDLRRTSGATIIGSARGAELAIDGGVGSVSVFTYALLEGLKKGNADTPPFDEQITVSEIQEYLGKKVQLLTGGAQRPIYRVENVGNDWRVW